LNALLRHDLWCPAISTYHVPPPAREPVEVEAPEAPGKDRDRLNGFGEVSDVSEIHLFRVEAACDSSRIETVLEKGVLAFLSQVLRNVCCKAGSTNQGG